MSEKTDALPDGWALTQIGEVCDVNPRRARAGALGAALTVSFVPMAAVDAESGAIHGSEDRAFASVQKGYTAFQDDDVIFARITPCMENGKSAVARGLTNGLGFGSTEFHVLRASEAVLPEYVYQLIRQDGFRREAAEHMTGAVGQARVPAEYMRDAPIPLPPLAEQRRIVDAAEALLTRVSAVRGRLERVPKILRRFRQSVLAAACDGRLTVDWRAAHPGNTLEADQQAPADDLPAGWSSVPLRRVVASIGQGWSPQCDPQASPSDDVWGVIKTTAVQPGRFDGAENKTLPHGLEPRPHLEIQEGDLLVTRAGPRSRAGISCLVRSTRRRLIVCDKVYRIRTDDTLLLAEYAELVLNEPRMVESIDSIKTGTSESGMNLTQGSFLGLVVPLPSLLEQAEIVRRADALLALADKIEVRVAAARRHTERTAQAVLAKAFRGELVPTEASLAAAEGREYESGADLMARLRETPAAAPRRRGRPPKAAPLFE